MQGTPKSFAPWHPLTVSRRQASEGSSEDSAPKPRTLACFERRKPPLGAVFLVFGLRRALQEHHTCQVKCDVPSTRSSKGVPFARREQGRGYRLSTCIILLMQLLAADGTIKLRRQYAMNV